MNCSLLSDAVSERCSCYCTSIFPCQWPVNCSLVSDAVSVFPCQWPVNCSLVSVAASERCSCYCTNIFLTSFSTTLLLHCAEFEVEQKTITVMGVRAVLDGGHIYMFGGFVGNMVGTLSRLTLPEDICAIFSHDECLSTMGCHICGNATAGVCFTAGKRRRRPLE